MVIPFLSHFLPFLFDIIANQRKVSHRCFTVRILRFRLCSRHEIAYHFIETLILWILFDTTSVDRIFWDFSLGLTPKLLAAISSLERYYF